MRAGWHEPTLIPLAEQDRGLEDRTHIAEGTELLKSALSKGLVGPYQLQAAIHAVHDEAESTEPTDWPQILALHELLEHMSDSSMVLLNRAIAAAMVHGPLAGLALLEQVAPRLARAPQAGRNQSASVRDGREPFRCNRALPHLAAGPDRQRARAELAVPAGGSPGRISYRSQTRRYSDCGWRNSIRRAFLYDLTLKHRTTTLVGPRRL